MKTLRFARRYVLAEMLVLLALFATPARADQEGDFIFLSSLLSPASSRFAVFSRTGNPRPRTGLALSLVRGRALTSANGAACRRTSITCSNGIALGAWYCPAATTNAPLVLLFHGYGGEKCGTASEAQAFLEMGLAVLLVDFRGSGASPAPQWPPQLFLYPARVGAEPNCTAGGRK